MSSLTLEQEIHNSPLSRRDVVATKIPKPKPVRIVAGAENSEDNMMRQVIARVIEQIEPRPELVLTTDEKGILTSAVAKRPSLVILDFASTDYNSSSLAEDLEWRPDVVVFGFYPYRRQREFTDKALKVGFDLLTPDIAFSESLRELLSSLENEKSDRIK